MFPSQLDDASGSCSYCPSAVSTLGLIARATSDTSYRVLRSRKDGDTLRAIERQGVPRVRLSASQLDSLAEGARKFQELLDRSNASQQQRDRFRSRTHPEFANRFISRSIRFDEEEKLWVQRAVTAGDSAEVDLFDVRSKYLGTMRFPPGAVLRRVSEGRALTTITYANDRTVIAEYRLVAR